MMLKPGRRPSRLREPSDFDHVGSAVLVGSELPKIERKVKQKAKPGKAKRKAKPGKAKQNQAKRSIARGKVDVLL